MATPVVVDSCEEGSPRSPLHSCPASPRKAHLPAKSSIYNDYRSYELGVLAITQLGYVPVTATMLSTTFYKSNAFTCNSSAFGLKSTNMSTTDHFYSVIDEWEVDCSRPADDSSEIVILTTSLMFGALIGSVIAGWLADAYGRRLVVKGSLVLLFVFNVAFVILAHYSLLTATLLMCILGMVAGGYMASNLVLLIECLELARSRLLAVSLNGWSVSMAIVAVMAKCTQHWLTFHLCIAVCSIATAAACHLWTVESCRWLVGVQRTSEARITALYVARRNGFQPTADASWWELCGFSAPVQLSRENDPPKSIQDNDSESYGYGALFRYPQVYLPLLALSYCFLASSVVSFVAYFSLAEMPGDRYTNMAIMGLSKFVMGLIPFFVCTWMGRRPIVVISVGVSCVASWCLCLSQILVMDQYHWSMLVFSLIVSAAMDPTWKINHLYSTELFPTLIRNKARGFCNMASRIGSVASPMIKHLGSQHYMIPYGLLTVVLTIQWAVVVGFLPETKDRPLPDQFPPTGNADPDDILVIEKIEQDEP